MVWSEKTSGDIVGEKGVMNTHDMETFNYFKGTQVHCALAPREMERFELTDYIQNEFATGLIHVNYLQNNSLVADVLKVYFFSYRHRWAPASCLNCISWYKRP